LRLAWPIHQLRQQSGIRLLLGFAQKQRPDRSLFRQQLGLFIVKKIQAISLLSGLIFLNIDYTRVESMWF
jgi:hypothetical protein